MIESIPVPSTIKSQLDQLMHPGETYGDVIEKLLICFTDDELSPEEEDIVSEGLEAIKAKKTIPHDQVMQELGVRWVIQ